MATIRFDRNDKRIINGTVGLNNIQPFKYPWAWQYFLNANKNHWSPEEITMTDDIGCYKELTASEKATYENTLGYLSTADIQAMRNVALGVLDKCTSPEHTMYMARQVYEEALHCYAEGTEILTPTGWMDMSSVTAIHDVLQYDKGVIKRATPLGITKDPYAGDMIHFLREGKVVEAVTPNHNVLAINKETGEEVLVKAGDFNNRHDVESNLGNVVSELTKLVADTTSDHTITATLVKETISEHLNLVNEKTLTSIFRRLMAGESDSELSLEDYLTDTIYDALYIIDDYDTVSSGTSNASDDVNKDDEVISSYHALHLAMLYVGASIGEVTEDTIIYHIPFRDKVTRKFIVDKVLAHQLHDTDEGIMGWRYNIETDELHVTTTKDLYFDPQRFKMPSDPAYQSTLIKYYLDLAESLSSVPVPNSKLLEQIELLCTCNGYTIIDRMEPDNGGYELNIVEATIHPVARTVERVSGYEGTVYSVGVDSRVIITKYNDEISICGNTWTYNVCIDSVGLDPDVIYHKYVTEPAIAAKISYSAEKLKPLLEPTFDLATSESIHDYLLSYIFFAAIFEGTWFYNGFTPIFALARNNKMRRTAEQLQYILRDEVLHACFGIDTVKSILEENPEVTITQEEIKQLFDDALKLEIPYADVVVPEPILDYTRDTYIETFKFIANRRVKRLGYDPVYPEVTEHPAGWVDKLVNNSKEKNFFETRVTEYQTGAIDDTDVTDEEY